MRVSVAAGPLSAALACVAALLVGAAMLSTASNAQPPPPPQTPVNVFPSPGSRFVSPQAQIVFRGLPINELGTITVRGNATGNHAGVLLSDSDGQGGSFIPRQPFAPTEQVTVTTQLNVVGGSGGSFSFRVANPGHGTFPGRLRVSPRVRGDVLRFRSEPGLTPVRVRVRRRSGRTARGDIFIGPEFGPLQSGPMILSPQGRLVWFKPLPGNEFASDVRVQRYLGKPVVTWWEGRIGGGVGVGQGVIDDTSYNQIAVVRAGNGLVADLHEFRLTPRGTALITVVYPVHTDATSVHGSKTQLVEDSVVQEIDIPTGLVLFQWDSLDHIPFRGTHARVKTPYDYLHLNSIDVDSDGNLVVSGRHTWAVYKINRHTGKTIWELGGNHSNFRLGPGARFAYQHDVEIRAKNERLLTMFDNESKGGAPAGKQSRGLTLRLDLRRHTATKIAEFDHSPSLISPFEGNVQQLPNGDKFIGWGEQPYFSEFDSRRRMIFDARFVDTNFTYRAYRFAWDGHPQTQPSVAVSTRGNAATIYVSWNGATGVARWRVLGGPSPASLTGIGGARQQGFETPIKVRRHAYLVVQALNGSGHFLGQSRTVQA